MLKALIVDDEIKGADTLRLMLKDNCPEVQLLGIANSVDDAISKINNLQPNIVFLDIQMPFGDGFSLLDKIGNVNFEVVFTTAHNEYAVKAFKHNAIDYLLKPVKSAELIRAVNKCREKLSQSAQLHKLQNKLNFLKEALVVHKIPIHTATETMLVDMEEIIRLEADGNYTDIFLESGRKLKSTKSLADYEKSLPPDIFLRIHKKHLINRTHVNTIKKGEGLIIMADGSVLEISRLKKAQILSVLAG
ncbi:MAG TPA: LytTR family DNA-binding domain-containing protein [Bacteroidia bacterium]|jgi:two-component system LytT family response regulator|nr:LytTR family DNA-binding domain-containing protein [Bacteroidia bacterium]